MEALEALNGSNFYDMPLSKRKKTPHDLTPAISRATFVPHGFAVGEKVEVFLRNPSKFSGGKYYPGKVTKVMERWCTVAYEDGNVFSDYFDSTLGSVAFSENLNFVFQNKYPHFSKKLSSTI